MLFSFFPLLLVQMFVRHAHGLNIRRGISKQEEKSDSSLSHLAGTEESWAQRGSLPGIAPPVGSAEWQEELSRSSLGLGSTSLEGNTWSYF